MPSLIFTWQDQTNEIRQNLILSAHGYLLMYTITSENSFYVSSAVTHACSLSVVSQMIEQINNRLLVQCGDDQVCPPQTAAETTYCADRFHSWVG